jgi:short-subunit dehydrogenase
MTQPPVTQAPLPKAPRPKVRDRLAPRLLRRSARRRVLDTRRTDACVAGLRVLITGASSGIGRETARTLAALGAEVWPVARRAAELEELAAEITAAGGTARPHRADLCDPEAVAALAERLHRERAVPDVLINNAGHSIRRDIIDTVGRFHDYERTIALNYLAPVRLTLALAPAMIARGGGHVVNIGTWGVTAGTMPRFAAYHASKAALGAFTADLDAELRGRGITTTAVHFPLVRTPMIAPTAAYRSLPALSVAEAAEWVHHAVVVRPAVVQPLYARALQLIGTLAPRAVARPVRRAGI